MRDLIFRNITLLPQVDKITNNSYSTFLLLTDVCNALSNFHWLDPNKADGVKDRSVLLIHNFCHVSSRPSGENQSEAQVSTFAPTIQKLRRQKGAKALSLSSQSLAIPPKKRYFYSVPSARLRRVTSGEIMMYDSAICPVRQAIDNRINRDLIAQAREQGFVFSDPFADAAIWQGLLTADVDDPARLCDPKEAEWLFVKALEASLFFIYQQSCRSCGLHPTRYMAQ